MKIGFRGFTIAQGECIGEPFQRRIAYSQGRFWILAVDLSIGSLVIYSSKTGLSYDNTIYILPTITQGQNLAGAMWHYGSIVDFVSVTDIVSAGNKLLYRRGTFQPDGSIVLGPIQTIGDWEGLNYSVSNPNICFNEDKYPAITVIDSSSQLIAWIGERNDGLWSEHIYGTLKTGNSYLGAVIIPIGNTFTFLYGGYDTEFCARRYDGQFSEETTLCLEGLADGYVISAVKDKDKVVWAYLNSSWNKIMYGTYDPSLNSGGVSNSIEFTTGRPVTPLLFKWKGTIYLLDISEVNINEFRMRYWNGSLFTGDTIILDESEFDLAKEAFLIGEYEHEEIMAFAYVLNTVSPYTVSMFWRKEPTYKVIMRGSISNIGENSVDLRGFKWGDSLSFSQEYYEGTEGNYQYGEGPYSITLEGLPSGLELYIKARAHNELGWAEGSTKIAKLLQRIKKSFTFLYSLLKRFNITSVSASPDKAVRSTSDTIVLTCQFIDDDDLDPSSYNAYFYVRAEDNTEFGPFTGDVTKLSSKHYEVKYTLDPTLEYPLGYYDVKAVVEKT